MKFTELVNQFMTEANDYNPEFIAIIKKFNAGKIKFEQMVEKMAEVFEVTDEKKINKLSALLKKKISDKNTIFVRFGELKKILD